MKFAFIAKHRGIWAVEWMCGALGVSRGGFYAWLRRPPSERSRTDEALSAKVRASFIGSDRSYGARRVWHDLLAEGVAWATGRAEAMQTPTHLLLGEGRADKGPVQRSCPAGTARSSTARMRLSVSAVGRSWAIHSVI